MYQNEVTINGVARAEFQLENVGQSRIPRAIGIVVLERPARDNLGRETVEPIGVEVEAWGEMANDVRRSIAAGSEVKVTGALRKWGNRLVVRASTMEVGGRTLASTPWKAAQGKQDERAGYRDDDRDWFGMDNG